MSRASNFKVTQSKLLMFNQMEDPGGGVRRAI